MKIIPYVQGTNIVLTLPAQEFPEILKRITAVAKNYLFVSTEWNERAQQYEAWLVGYDSEASTALLKLNASAVENEGSFRVDPTVLGTVCGSRKTDLKFTFLDGTIYFEAVKGKYNGTIPAIPLAQDIVTQVNETIERVTKQETLINNDTYQALLLARSYAGITDIFNPQARLVRYIEVRDDKVEVSSFGNYHMALAVATIQGNKAAHTFQMALTDDYFAKLTTIIPEPDDKGVKVVVTEHTFAARTPTSFLFVPPTQAPAGFGTVQEQINLYTSFDLTFKTMPSRLSAPVQSCCAVYQAGSSVDAAVTKEGLSLKMKTGFGEIADVVMIEEPVGKAKFSLDPYSFLDLMRLLPPDDLTVQFGIKQGNCYRVDYSDYSDGSDGRHQHPETITVTLLGSLHSNVED